MNYLSLFSGIGGFEIGIHRAFNVPQKRRGKTTEAGGEEEIGDRLHPLPEQGASDLEHGRYEHDNGSSDSGQPHCVGFSEIDRYATKVYERNFNGHKNYGDITKIDAKLLPDFDCLVGGFPCQAFSVAGKRGGFDDTRGTLFFDIARILAEKRPRYLVLENVKGLLSHDGGKTFQTIIGVLSDLGYRVEWQLLNSKDFGVPQNRERIYIVGCLRDQCGGEVFPILGTASKNLKELTQGVSDAMRVYDTDGSSKTLSSLGGGLGAKTGLYPAGIDLSTKEARHTDHARTIQARYHKGYSHRTAETTGVDEGKRIRRLTPRECERLQGFPDDWTKYGPDDEPISDTQRYKMCGNAVTTNVIQAIFESIIKNGLQT